MGFEDDMIEGGFANEQDYLDFLIAEADSSNQPAFTSQDALLFQRQLREREPLERWLRMVDDRTRRIWHAISYRINYRYQADYWADWMKSDALYKKWHHNNKEEINKLLNKDFQDYFNNYLNNCEIHDIVDLNASLIAISKTNNSTIQTNEEEVWIRAWKEELTHKQSSETIIYHLWLLDNEKEWINWLHANYPRIKTVLNDRIDFNKFLKVLFDDSQSLPNNPRIKIIDEHVKDWWNYYFQDIKAKHNKAKELGYDLLFSHSKDFSSIDKKPGVEISIRMVMYHRFFDRYNYKDSLQSIHAIRPLTLSKDDSVLVVLPGAYVGDLSSEVISEEEQEKIWEIEDEIFDEEIEELKAISEYENSQFQTKYNSWPDEKKQELESLIATDREKSILSLSLLDDRDDVELGTQDFNDYISHFTKYGESFLDHDRLGWDKRIIYYFLKDSLDQNTIDQLYYIAHPNLDISSFNSYQYMFNYKTYPNDKAFEISELSYEDFNHWCFHHSLPTISDYILKYWLYNEADYDQVLCSIWLTMWRGYYWIKDNLGDSISDARLFELWRGRHFKEWNEWLKEHSATYRHEYITVSLLSKWIEGGNYSLKDIIRIKNSQIIDQYRKALKEAFDNWLNEVIPYRDWKKDNKDIIPQLKKRFDRIRILKIWNKAHPHNKMFIPGLLEH